MGLGNSKLVEGGCLTGAYAPPLPGIRLPEPKDPAVKKYSATCPPDKKGGDKMVLNLNGENITITIPLKFRTPDGGQRNMRPGDKFKFEFGHYQKVIASTLPSVPGCMIVEAKPIIYATVADSYYMSDRGKPTANLQEAQQKLLQQAVELGCNAVLSINQNITLDSSGDTGNYKFLVVTLIGTPCIILPLESLPPVQAEAELVPYMQY